MSSQNINFFDMISNWTEITEEFKNASKDLKLGELFHDELFGLFEAMSAIEMMDPKMDGGMLCNRERKVLNFEESLKEGKIKIKNLSNEEKIGIIDDTFGCLVTWLEGHTLAQTVFTNLYLHNPSAIEDKCIRSFSFLILKMVEIIRDFIVKSKVLKDEDFHPYCGCLMPCEISDNKACGMMREVEEELQRRIKSFQRANLSKSINDEVNDKLNSNYTSFEKDHEMNLGLCSRIKFSRLFFQSLMTLKKEVSLKNSNCKKLSINVNAINDVERHYQQCLEAIQTWRETIDFGIKANTSSSTSNELRADYPTIMGFEPLVNQRLLPPTFLRYIKIKSRIEAVNYLESLIHRLKHVCQIYSYVTFHSALDFFIEFSKQSSTPSCILSRSILQEIYLPIPGMVFGVHRLTDVLKEDIRRFIRPPCLFQRSSILFLNSHAKECVELFFEHCARPLTFLLQINGHNRARQREKLSQVLEELAGLQEEAEKLDTFLNSISQKQEDPCSHMGYFSTWILYYILRVMIQYILSGFELELYATHEYSYIFWYLYEFLFNWYVSTLNRARNLILEQEALSEQRNRNTKKVKSKKKKQKPHQRECIINQGLQQLCGGYYKTVCAFKMEGKLKIPCSGLNSEQIRYEHRFMPFNNVIAPPSVSYLQYKEMTDQSRFGIKQKSRDLYLTACKCFESAKKFFETITDANEEIMSFVKIAKTNFVVIKLLLSGHKEESKLLPEFDFSLHHNFPIIRIL